MIHHKANNEEWLLVYATAHTDRIVWEKGNEGKVLWVLSKTGEIKDHHRLKPPPGSWSIIGRASELNELQKLAIVEYTKEKGSVFNSNLGHYQSAGWTTFYKNYLHPEPSICIPNTPDESFQSLLAAHNLKESETLILKRDK